MHWDRPGEGRRGHTGEQGSTWDKKRRPPWAPLYQSVSLAPQTGSPEPMNGSLDGTSETLSRCRNFSLYFLGNPHSPVPQLTRPSLVFLSFWCEPDFTPIKDHTRERHRVINGNTGSLRKTLPTGKNPASGPKSNSSHPNFSSDLNLGCNGNHTLMSALSMYQYAAGLVSLMMVIKLWRWPEGVPHPAIFSRQHASLCAHTCLHTHKQDSL